MAIFDSRKILKKVKKTDKKNSFLIFCFTMKNIKKTNIIKIS